MPLDEGSLRLGRQAAALAAGYASYEVGNAIAEYATGDELGLSSLEKLGVSGGYTLLDDYHEFQRNAAEILADDPQVFTGFLGGMALGEYLEGDAPRQEPGYRTEG